MINLFLVEKIFDEYAILTYSAYFVCCLPLFWINIRGARSANVGNLWLKGTCAELFVSRVLVLGVLVTKIFVW